CHHHNSYPFTF
nr:immunoglobulin light chain junction region [Macaca mulatta]MOW10454.1 immunoglobulin light chain junction region [Macaca mulatta]MOW12281.1 immunoglobulin light chain junction region [Macaca mulatta]MOW12780.1 immunoglobulin light chain junction region [Macaca mulatta]MOW13348.1 immunoglobulin light chain junction region [Macaca mulatta]